MGDMFGISAGVSGFAGGMTQMLGNLYQNQQAQRATGDAQNFAQFMANTTYRRAVRDLRLAGLNPALAYTQGGAPSPSVGAASVVSPSAGFGDFSNRFLSNVMGMKKLRGELKILAEEGKRKENEADASRFLPAIAANSAAQGAQGVLNSIVDRQLKSAQMGLTNVQSLRTAVEKTLLEKDVPLAELKARLAGKGVGTFNEALENVESSLPGMWEKIKSGAQDFGSDIFEKAKSGQWSE